jgi:CheY-like chemotaxis protein
MIDDLLSLRVLVVTPADGVGGLFRQAATASTVLVEIREAADAAAAGPILADGVDLAYIDGALPPHEITALLAALRASPGPPFSILLASASTAGRTFDTDGLAGRPSRAEEAGWLLERSMRVRVPSRALVVDDSATMRSIVRKSLAATRFQFNVTEAEEGFAALELVRNGEFDIVFLDYNMPGFSGLETLAEFKRLQHRLSVVMITSMQDEALAARARSLGAAFLKKPFFPADIETVLCGYYGLRALNPRRA